MPEEVEGVEVEINRIDSVTGIAASHNRDHLHSHDHHHAHDHNQEHDHEHPHDHATHRPHVAVVARPTPLGVIHSLVFPELVEGNLRALSSTGRTSRADRDHPWVER
jgi:ABC-type Zn2+ transport system substrate-binding protein/surface adhesin